MTRPAPFDEPAEESERSLREAGFLLDLGGAILGVEDSAELFDALSDAIGPFMAFDRAALLLCRQGGRALELHALSGRLADRRPWPIGTHLALADLRAAAAIERRAPLIIDDLAEPRGTYFDRQLVRLGARALLALPLLAGDRILGMFAVARGTPRSFGKDDMQRLSRAAPLIALGVEKLLAFEQIDRLEAELEQEKLYLQEEIRQEHDFEDIVGRSPGLLEVLEALKTVAPTGATVLITGETGTGKELIARAVHDRSARRHRTLVKLNCAAIPRRLVESELFGHERGAFTGAVERKQGRFELADAGTIFLDEIGDLPLELQSKLLRVLQEGEFERVGGTTTLKVDVRVIAATNRNLEQAVEEGRFRSDLYYRLNVFPLQLPPLRARGDDIRLLTEYFVERFARKLGKPIPAVPRETMRRLASYTWPGNVRELANVIERAVILSQGESLDVGRWFQPSEADPPRARSTKLADVQRAHILAILERTEWRVRGDGGAAELLGLKPTTLDYRMKKLGIRRPDA